MIENIKNQLTESIRVKQSFSEELVNNIAKAGQLCIDTINRGGIIFACGNGGSAADSQHFVAELVSKYCVDRQALPAIALTTNTSTLTSTGNDYDYSLIFARQIEALGKTNDLLFAISTSGNSANVIKAIEGAKNKGLSVIGLTGANGGKMHNLCDILLNIPSTETPRIQESHILAIHIICDLIEQHFVANPLREHQNLAVDNHVKQSDLLRP